MIKGGLAALFFCPRLSWPAARNINGPIGGRLFYCTACTTFSLSHLSLETYNLTVYFGHNR